MIGNVCYQKTDYGMETPDLLNKYVLKITEIAGIALKTDISVEQLKKALSVPTSISELINDTEYITRRKFTETIQALKDVDVTIESDIITLFNQIESETSYRQNADKIISENIQALQIVSHTHENKKVIDAITNERVIQWDRIQELDALFEYVEFKKFVEELLYGFTTEIQNLYGAMGVTFYDGGLFGMIQDGPPLDGGDFESEPTDIFDCGGFEPLKITISAGAVIDGGTY